MSTTQDIPVTNLWKALAAAGWTVNDARKSPRAYVDTASRKFGTLENNGVRVSMTIGHTLGDERGAVMVYQSDEPTDVILRALIVDADVRRQGRATGALTELVQLADTLGTTLYLEPVSIDDKTVNSAALVALYRAHGFVFAKGSKFIMCRTPATATIQTT